MFRFSSRRVNCIRSSQSAVSSAWHESPRHMSRDGDVIVFHVTSLLAAISAYTITAFAGQRFTECTNSLCLVRQMYRCWAT